MNAGNSSRDFSTYPLIVRLSLCSLENPILCVLVQLEAILESVINLFYLASNRAKVYSSLTAFMASKVGA